MSKKQWQWQWHLQPLSPFTNDNDESTETQENKNKDYASSASSSSLQLLLLKSLSLPGNFGREELLRPLSKLCPVCSVARLSNHHHHHHRGTKSKSPRKRKVVVLKRPAIKPIKPMLCNVCQSIQRLATFIPRQNFLSFVINNDCTQQQQSRSSSSSGLVLKLSGHNLSRLVRITSSSSNGDTNRNKILPNLSSSEPRYEIFDGDIISLLCSGTTGDGGGTNAEQSQFYNMVPLVQFRVINTSSGGIITNNDNISNKDDAMNEDKILQESRSVSVSILMDKGEMQHTIIQHTNKAQTEAEQKSNTSNGDALSTGTKTIAAKSNVQENSIVEDTIEIDHPASMENEKKEEDKAIAARDCNSNEKVHIKQTANLDGEKKYHHADDGSSSSSSSSEDEHLWTAGGFLKTRSTKENKTPVARGNYVRDIKTKYDRSKNQQHSNNHIKIKSNATEQSTMSYNQDDAPSCMESTNNDGGSKCEEAETEESESAPLTLPSQFLASYSKSFDSTEKQQSPSSPGTLQKSNQSIGKRTQHHDKIMNSSGQEANNDAAATKTPKKSNVSINSINIIPVTKKTQTVPILLSSLSYNQLQQLRIDSTPPPATTVSAADHQRITSSSSSSSTFRHTVLSFTLALTSNASSYDSNFLRRCKTQRTSDEDNGDQHEHDQQQWMPRLLQGTKVKCFDKDG